MTMQQPAEERFQEIYRRHRLAVATYARRRASADAAEDVVAETFLVCWRKLDRVPEEPLPWLCAVARKTLANQRRAAARQPTPAIVEIPTGATVFASDPRLGAAFARLSERDREVLRLVAWEGLSLGEAATALGCSAVACRVRYHRAKRRLAERLEELERHAAAPLRFPRRAALAAAFAAAAIGVPAVAFADELGSLFGFSTEGKPVPTSASPFTRDSSLNQAMEELGFPSRLHLVTERDGVRFYAAGERAARSASRSTWTDGKPSAAA
jgi:RNA polymerase sigma-70 factor, ECF subfamily